MKASNNLLYYIVAYLMLKTCSFDNVQRDSTIQNFDNAVCFFSNSSVMGNNDKSGSQFLIDFPEQLIDTVRGLGIQITGGFVGQNNFG